MAVLYRDRQQAGVELARRLEAYRGRNNVVVLGLPRGGMVPALEVARALGLPLDMIMVRKLTLPGEPPRSIGAITSGGHTLLNEDAIERYQATEGQVHEAELQARHALQLREEAYRGVTPNAVLKDQTVILVDDGMKSGATMQVAIAAVHNQGPARIVVAVPLASTPSLESLLYADEVVCLQQPQGFTEVHDYYQDFPSLGDEQVADLFRQAAEFQLHEIDIPPFTSQ